MISDDVIIADCCATCSFANIGKGNTFYCEKAESYTSIFMVCPKYRDDVQKINKLIGGLKSGARQLENKKHIQNYARKL